MLCHKPKRKSTKSLKVILPIGKRKEKKNAYLMEKQKRKKYQLVKRKVSSIIIIKHVS